MRTLIRHGNDDDCPCAACGEMLRGLFGWQLSHKDGSVMSVRDGAIAGGIVLDCPHCGSELTIGLEKPYQPDQRWTTSCSARTEKASAMTTLKKQSRRDRLSAKAWALVHEMGHLPACGYWGIGRASKCDCRLPSRIERYGKNMPAALSTMRQILQSVVADGGWAYFGDFGKCVYCGAYEGDGMSSRYHQTACLIDRSKRLAKQIVQEESMPAGLNEHETDIQGNKP